MRVPTRLLDAIGGVAGAQGMEQTFHPTGEGPVRCVSSTQFFGSVERTDGQACLHRGVAILLY